MKQILIFSVTFFSFCQISAMKKRELSDPQDTYGKYRVLKTRGQQVIAGKDHGGIEQWNLKTGECLTKFRAHRGIINDIILTKKGTLSCATDGKIKIWRHDFKGKPLHELTQSGATSLAFIPQYLRLVCASMLNKISIWDLTYNVQLASIPIWSSHIKILDEKTVACSDQKLSLYDVETLMCKRSWCAQEFRVRDLAIIYNLIALSTNEYVKLYDPRMMSCAKILNHPHGTNALAVHFHRLYSGGFDTSIKKWDLRTDKCITTYNLDQHPLDFEVTQKQLIACNKNISSWPLHTLTIEDKKFYRHISGQKKKKGKERTKQK